MPDPFERLRNLFKGRNTPSSKLFLVRTGVGYFIVEFDKMKAQYASREEATVDYEIRRIDGWNWKRRNLLGGDWEPLQQGFSSSHLGDFATLTEQEYQRYIAQGR